MNPKIPHAAENLMSAGRSMLLDCGYEKLSVNDLAASCGMATGTFYHYFKSKKDLAFRVIDKDWDAVLEVIDDSADSDAALIDKLESMEDALRKFRDDLCLISRGLPQDADEFCERRTRRFSQIKERVNRLVKEEAAKGNRRTGGLGIEALQTVIVNHMIAESFFETKGLSRLLEELHITNNDEDLAKQYHEDSALRDKANDNAAMSKMYENATLEAKLIIMTYDPLSHEVTMMPGGYTDRVRKIFDLPEVIEDAPNMLSAYVDKKYKDAFLATFRAIDEGKQDSRCDFRFQMPGQESSQYERIILKRIESDGRLLTVQGLGQNITEQKEIEERFNRAYELLDDPQSYGSFHLNLSKNLCEDGRAGKSKMDVTLELKRSGTFDQFFENFSKIIIDEDIREKCLRTFNRERLLEQFEAGTDVISIEYPIMNEKGARHWLEGFLRMVRNPATGDVEALAYSYTIDSRKRGEAILRKLSDHRFDYIGLIRPAMRTIELISCKDGFGFGMPGETYDYDVIIQAMSPLLIDENENEAFKKIVSLDTILSALEKDGLWTATFSYTGTGETKCIDLQCCWLSKPGGDILLTQMDVTQAYMREREQLEEIKAARLEAERANEAKSAFLSTMSHDIRTPLNGIVGFTNFALTARDPETARHHMKKVGASADILLGLINDVLDLSRIESGKMSLEPEPTPTKDIDIAVIEALRPIAEAKNIKLIAGPFADAMVYVDKTKHQKIWLNLVSNAIKYTPEGGTVEARVETIDPPIDGHNRRMIVMDTGIGMTDEFQEVMFEPFSQEIRSEKTGIQGTGLGLAIVKNIVDLLGGTMRVRSVRGKGTRYEIDINVQTLEEGEAAQKENSEKAEILSGKRVLLCEDNEMNAEIASMLLKQRGIEADWAIDGKQGLERFKASSLGYYDAILMDVRMPIMDGREATRAIRDLNREDAQTVPIIALTADAFEEDIRDNREAGMDAHVNKPINPDRLFKTISNLFTLTEK